MYSHAPSKPTVTAAPTADLAALIALAFLFRRDSTREM
jgi:hypothetical protein